ncbi:MAG: L,D-transpeptidase, partial [Solirubrobacteraceae bacterium]
MRRSLTLIATCLLALLGAMAGVAAAAPAKPAKPAALAKPAKPAGAHARLNLVGSLIVHGSEVTIPGRAVRVQGVVRPYVAGQWVAVQALDGTRSFKRDRLRIKRACAGRCGEFSQTLHGPAPGIVRVHVTHARTAAMRGFSIQRAYQVLGASAGPGATGRLVQLVQQRLTALHVYVPQSGVFDTQTGLALDAYHRLLGWGEGDLSLDARTLTALLDGRGAFAVRYPHDGRHAEGDLTHQLLALIDGADVQAIYPISSGKPSTPTILGRFAVYSRVPGYLPDGMYYSDFFIRGYAVHGYDPAPDYPASHGCMRLPIIDAT